MKKNEEKEIVPPDGVCKCGGTIWKVEKNLWKCGHCLRKYISKGSGEDNNV